MLPSLSWLSGCSRRLDLRISASESCSADRLCVQVEVRGAPSPWKVLKSPESFLELRDRLAARFPEHQAALCFKKRARDKDSAPVDFLAALTEDLQAWTEQVTAVEEMAASDELEAFLAVSDSGILEEEEEEEVLEEAEESRRKVGLEDFERIKVIGKGSFGKVLLVRKKDSGQIFAMKVISKKNVLKRNQVEHTKTERNVLEFIRHPFIVSLWFAFQTKAHLYLVLDYCEGGELFFHLGKELKFSEQRTKFYTAQIVLALEYLHDLGIVYRDLKPENVLLDAMGNVALTDFGLSKEGISDNTSANSFCGTPEYLAPEILKRSGHGRAADWWSLGALVYEMLTGIPPFYSRDREKLFAKILKASVRLPQHLSDESKSFLLALLNRNPAKRLGSVHGAKEIKEHPFLHGIDWDRILLKKIEPPFRPGNRDRADSLDTSNFDEQFTMIPLDSEMENETHETVEYDFLGFTYIGSHNAE